MPRLKHRVIVEVTFDKRVTAKTAANIVRRNLDLDTLNDFYQVPYSDEEVTKVTVKEAERVIQGEINWRNRRLPSEGEPGEP